MQEELERSEEIAKKSRVDNFEKKKRELETERIKEEGRKMRERAQKEAEDALAASIPEPPPETQTDDRLGS